MAEVVAVGGPKRVSNEYGRVEAVFIENGFELCCESLGGGWLAGVDMLAELGDVESDHGATGAAVR